MRMRGAMRRDRRRRRRLVDAGYFKGDGGPDGFVTGFAIVSADHGENLHIRRLMGHGKF
jgi:hypothetical protein